MLRKQACELREELEGWASSPRPWHPAVDCSTIQKDAAKLGRSGVELRHLFMSVDMHTRRDVVRAFDEGTSTVPSVVDDTITVVWLAVETRRSRSAVVA